MSEKARLGVIRVSDVLWAEHSEAIKRNLSDGKIVDILQALGNGTYRAAKDIILIHPEFEEIDVEGSKPFIYYEVEFFPQSDGAVARGPMVKPGLR